MSLQSRGLRLAPRLMRQVEIPTAELPTFLCPAILSSVYLQRPRYAHQQPLLQPSQHRAIHLGTSNVAEAHNSDIQVALERLPTQCPGCGALTQTVFDEEPGFYSLNRRSVREFIEHPSSKNSAEDAVVGAALQKAENNAIAKEFSTEHSGLARVRESPICNRCHNLKHHQTGVSIHHPSVQSIQDTLFESPYKYNHVYHVLDAADFPMSLVPGLYKLLHLTPQRSLNRRSKSGKFYHGRKTEVSFIITRSDLLAPMKEQVDRMMPYLLSILRDALERSGKDVRLGNVRCVSAKRGWWTKELKEDIWNRGGGGWMVGKVNVGKSQLFHEVFPKGRLGRGVDGKPRSAQEPLKHIGPTASRNKSDRLSVESGSDSVELPGSPTEVSENGETSHQETETILVNSEAHQDTPDVEVQKTVPMVEKLPEVEAIAKDFESTMSDTIDTTSLLPPARTETNYPAMPLVSSLPGTTASPIRVPFGNGKGELIDLPGLSRGDLELHVQPEHRSSLVMRSRILPEQKVVKPGQSLLLGGFIRITPTTPNIIFLAYAFAPIDPHLTSTEKAIGTQTQTRESTVQNISLPGTGKKIASAGTFHLKWDVTRRRTGPITRSDAAGIKPERLPYRVMATDILIEGCGWVELVAQIRKPPGEMSGFNANDDRGGFNPEENEMDVDPSWPTVEVFTPEGKFISSRRPMNAWELVSKKPSTKNMKARPRKPMKGAKKREKINRRLQTPL